MAIVITGNPGVGKHTVSKSLAKILNYKILDINKIAIDFGVFEKKGNTLDVDVKKLKKLLGKKITKKSIVVGHLAPYTVPKKQVTRAIILRKNPYSLSSIYKKRKYSSEKIAENLGSEILGIVVHDSVKHFGKKKCLQIDTTSKSVKKITKSIIDALEDKIESDSVDWLTLISKRNDLKKFFSY